MSTSLKVLTVAAALIAGIATTSTLYAHGDGDGDGDGVTTNVTANPMAQGNMMQGRNNMPKIQGDMAGNMTGNMMGMMAPMMKTHANMMKQMMEEHSKADSGKKQ